MTRSIDSIIQKLSPLTSAIVNHPLYANLTSITHLRLFMEQHVFAVWDFMCLLKELHRGIVSTSAPWFPPKDAMSANLIGSILAEEEGDIAEDGENYMSHYEIYLCAMEKIGANTQPIKQLQTLLIRGISIQEAIEQLPIRDKTKSFVLTTFSFFEREVHEIAAAFVFGREGITTSMFSPVVTKIEADMRDEHPEKLSTLIYYLKRHIELDGNEHFPKALKMMANLIGNDSKKLREAEAAAATALRARIEFLDDIHRSIVEYSSTLVDG